MSSKKSTSHKKKGNLSTDTSSKPTVQQIGDFFNHHGLAVNAILFLIFFNILIRFSVGLETYSGYKKPPMHGDYEAQRHWMEITTNLKPEQWYVQSEDNDLLYWGLDYPPLTAYHHYILGLISRYFEPASVQLHTSRGYETPSHKLFMRSAVVVTDVLIYFTAVYLFVYHSYYKDQILRRKFEAFAFILIQPALILIDHGHFQFNSICLGLTVLAIHNILQDRELLGSFYFVLALNYKQMSLYYAPVFFFYLLGKSIAQARHNTSLWISKVLAIGIVVLATFALCWQPFLRDTDVALQVLSRMFPVGRGLFEDKVANFWCTLSPFIKLKTLFSPDLLLKMCTVTTLIAMAPSCLIALLQPNARTFLSSLFNTSMAFFLFSYQAHEKSILLPLLPITLLTSEYDYLSVWLITTASFSMVPLLWKDGLVLAYTVLQISSVLFYLKHKAIRHSLLFYLHLFVMIALHIVHATVTPPARYPDIITLAITSYSFVIFFLSFLRVNWRQWREYLSASRAVVADHDAVTKGAKSLAKEKKIKTVKHE